MRLVAMPFAVVGVLLALLLGGLLLYGGLRGTRFLRRFGDEGQVRGLRTADPAMRRAVKGLLLVVAIVAAFFAAAQPQYGRGTRVIPATNLDVVLVLDFSKSMYAQDVQPSRIFRAKQELGRLVKQLKGARFGAVAFAGEPMGFPLSADGAAIAQFLRGLTPNDMPLGGTAIARALRYADKMLERDPKSAEHRRVIVLITDGEDLEGRPAAVARRIGANGTSIVVVQIGGRTPERIPDVDAHGRVVGYRSDKRGRPLMTSLSPKGERTLQQIADATPGGQLIRAERGTTGIDEVTKKLKRQMKGELGERVEDVYADIFYYPLGVALLLLLLEALLPEVPRRRFVRKLPPPKQPLLKRRRRRSTVTGNGHG